MPINSQFPSSQTSAINEASNGSKESKKKEHTTKLVNAYLHFQSPAYAHRDDSKTYLAKIALNDLKVLALKTKNSEQSGKDFQSLEKFPEFLIF